MAEQTTEFHVSSAKQVDGVWHATCSCTWFDPTDHPDHDEASRSALGHFLEHHWPHPWPRTPEDLD